MLDAGQDLAVGHPIAERDALVRARGLTREDRIAGVHDADPLTAVVLELDAARLRRAAQRIGKVE